MTDTWIGGLADDQIVTLIHIGFITKILGSLLQKGENLLVAPVFSILVRSTRNLSDLKEVLPD